MTNPEYCPRCRASRNVSVQSISRRVTTPDGEVRSVRSVRTRSYHCASCRQFIRSEDVEEGASLS